MTDEFHRAVDRLVNRVAHWTPSRWAASSVSGSDAPSRADVMHALVQRLADAAADAQRRPRRPVPRLDNDLALPDQLRVIAADLVAAEPDPSRLAELAGVIRATDP
ncbi:MAG: hypothetical protein QOE03_2146 [Micromonosporaceae bacterium]|nr:hypothetical protein [Micromonosporaceae bacterium]